MSFVIDATQRYQAVFDSISKLMERLHYVFERLRVLLANKAEVKLDENLRPPVYRILAEFVKILAKTYDMTHGRFRRVKLGYQVAIGKDGGISESLEKVETLIANITDIQIDQIHSGMDEALRTIDNIDENLQMLVEEIQRSAIQIGAAVGQMRNRQNSKDEKAAVFESLLIGKDDQCWKVHSEGFSDRL